MDVLKQIADEYDTYKDQSGEELVPRWDLIEKLNLKVGEKLSWMYREDYQYYRNQCPEVEIHTYAPYHGILIQLPDTEHFSIEQNVIVMITSYPTEKCYPEITYVSLIKLLSDETLHAVYKN